MDSRELMEMKEQLSILTKKLERETIVNERLMRSVTKEKISKMQRYVLIKAIAIACLVPYMHFITYWLGISPWFCAFTFLLLVLALFSDYLIHRNLRSDEAMSSNLLEVRRKALRIKQAHQNWIKFRIPIHTIWICWFSNEIVQQPSNSPEAIFIGLSSIGIFGGIIGFLQYKKIQHNADEILQQIEEMKV